MKAKRMKQSPVLTVQRWGNSLAVRIPAAVARSARFSVGVPVELTLQGESVLLSAVGPAALSLDQKLAAFDPERHGGEALRSRPVGKEVL
jgi:antitoxin MazE